jgi:hypothetical protein
MVKKQFQNLDVECWWYKGKIGTSPFTLCFYHSTASPCEELIAALDELAADPLPAKRLVTVKPCSRDRCVSTLRLRHVAERGDLRVMHVSRAGDIVTIEMTTVGLALIRGAIVTWGNGAEDFGVGADRSEMKKEELGALDLASSEIWFWGPYYFAP